YDTAGTLVVSSSPDFSGSGIKISESSGVVIDGASTVTYGDTIVYKVDVSNTGDMDAENIDVRISSLENLVLDPEENGDFVLSADSAVLKIDNLDAGQKESFYLAAHIDTGAENNSVINPELKISFWGSVASFKAPESIIKLYPSFVSSSVSIAARGGGGLYSGDVVDVNVSVKNTGDIEAENVIVKLVISNLFMLEQGQTSWEIAKLEKGQSASFQASLKIIEGIVKDTNAGVTLRVSSEGISEAEVGKSSVLVSGERPFTRGVIPIVALHGIEPDPHGNYEISTAAFDYLCGTLKAMGYKTITFADLLAYLDSGKRLPEKPVILTSDDGYYSIYAYAFPILQNYGYKMTVFLSTGYIGNSNEDRHLNEFDIGKSGIPVRPMLIWPEVAAMARYGIEFQSHSVTHSQIGDLSSDEVYFELAQSKADIESHLKRPCVFISWPFDNFSNSVIPLLPQVGYRGAIRYKGGVEDVRSMNIYAIKRVQIFSYTSTSSYAALMGLF
ncbi:MAG: hypothetical protein FJW66_05525, partial [Actinobacteria bacterium]|nr:hypothetical protein [Actinomycetota bacterium]